MEVQLQNKLANENDFLNSICYCATFILLLLSIVYYNERLVFYSFEIIYIFIIGVKALKENIKISNYALWSIIFFTDCLLSYLYAIDQFIAFKQIFNLLKTLLISNSILFFINNDENKLNFILKSIIISVFYLSILLIIKTPSYQWGTERLGESVGLNSNDLGLKMTISSIISVYFGKSKKYYYLLAIIFAVISLFSGSRKAFLMLIICIVFFSILTIKNKSYLIIIVPLLICLTYAVWNLVMTVPYLYNVLGNRIELMFNGILGHGEVDNSTLTRLHMIDYGIELFKQKPFWGYGIFNYSALTIYAYSHNNYIELLVGVGIIGTVIYYSLYVSVIYKLFMSFRKTKYASLFIPLITGLALMEYGLVSYYEEVYQILIVCAFSSEAFKYSKWEIKYDI